MSGINETVAVDSESVLAFIAAQVDLLDATEKADDAFVASAVACFDAWENGATLQVIADANKRANRDYKVCRGARYLYTSLEAVTIHALTGALYSHGLEDDDEDAYMVPVKVQTIVNRVKRAAGIKRVRAIVTKSQTVASAVDALLVLEAKVKAQNVKTDETGSETDETETDETETESNAQTVETLLSRALAMVTNGATVSDAARELISQLAGTVESTPLSVVA